MTLCVLRWLVSGYGFQLGRYVERHNVQLLTTMCIGGQYTWF
jgi:hypothetical protein